MYKPEIENYIGHPVFVFLVQFMASLCIQGSWADMYKRIGKIGYILNPLLMFVQGNVMKYFLGVLSQSLDFKPQIIFAHLLATVIVFNYNVNTPILSKITGFFTIFFDYGGLIFFLEQGLRWNGYIGAFISVMMSYVFTPFFYTYIVVFILKRQFIGLYVKWSTFFKRLIFLTVQTCVYLYMIKINSMYTYHTIVGVCVFSYIDCHWLHLLDKLFNAIGLH